MPSIIFHLTEAKLITQHLREASADYPFTHIHGWQNDFTIGSILPDAIPRPLKYKTHSGIRLISPIGDRTRS